MTNSLRATLAAVLLCAFTACGKKDDHAGHDHSAHKHVHTAPHGGTLVEVGEHAYNIELLRDAATGKLTAWVLDGHAENFIRIKAPALELVATVAGAKQTLSLAAIANPATNEKVGDTSQFEATADWLKTTTTFDGVFPTLVIRESTFSAIKFNFPKGSD